MTTFEEAIEQAVSAARKATDAARGTNPTTHAEVANAWSRIAAEINRRDLYQRHER